MHFAYFFIYMAARGSIYGFESLWEMIVETFRNILLTKSVPFTIFRISILEETENEKVMTKRSMCSPLSERMIHRLKDHLKKGTRKVALEPGD